VQSYIVKKYSALFEGKGSGSIKLRKYGWTTLKYEIAKEKVFDLGGLNSIQSVEQSDLNEVLFYAMVEKIKIDEQAKAIK
jgi:hypothetical protein